MWSRLRINTRETTHVLLVDIWSCSHSTI